MLKSWTTVGAKTPIQEFWVRGEPDFSLDYIRNTHVLTPHRAVTLSGQTLEWLGADIPQLNCSCWVAIPG